jgi:hypothetical protein
MSFEAMTWAVKQKLPALQKLVLLMLANRTNHDTGQCNPRHRLLSEDCGMSETSVKVAIRALADAGLLTIQERRIESVQLPNQYVLHIPGAQPEGGGACGAGGVGRNTPPGGRHTPTEPGREPGRETNTPHTPQGGQAGDADASKKRGSAVCFKTWLEAVKEKGERAIPEGDPIFAWADSVSLPRHFLSLAWAEFKSRYSQKTKRYTDWRAVFRSAVRENWLKLWLLNGDTYTLTTVGQQAQMIHGEGA